MQVTIQIIKKLIILQVIGAINYEGHKIDPTYAEQCIEIQSTNNSPIG